MHKACDDMRMHASYMCMAEYCFLTMLAKSCCWPYSKAGLGRVSRVFFSMKNTETHAHCFH